MTDTNEIKYIHIRPYSYSSHGFKVTRNDGPDAKGGCTIAFYTDSVPDEQGTLKQVVHFAIARCSPKDNYVKETGRVKARGRLYSKDHAHYFVAPFDITYHQLDDMIVEQANSLIESRQS